MTASHNHGFNDERLQEGNEAIRAAFARAKEPPIAPGALSPGIGDKRAPTEESLSREWVSIHGADWRFDPVEAKWFHWSGEIWVRDEAGLAFHLIGEHLRAAGAATNKHSIATTRTAKGVEAFAKVNPRTVAEHSRWDADPWLLGTPAGTVDLRTGQLSKSHRDHWITRSTLVAPQPGRPERWLQFIREATDRDDELGRYLQLMLGYALTGSTREHALFFIFGAGKNGKSVLLNTATKIMGTYAVTAAMDTFVASKGDRHPTDLARLDGARLVAASETEEGRAWAEARIKQLTGGDRVAARFMRQDFFEFDPRFKLLIVGNHRPVLHNVDEATKRRFNIIPFVHTPPNPDKELEAKLSHELPQILAWIIEGARLWFVEGLKRPEVLVAATDSYFADQDLLGQWITERCEVRKGAMGRAASLYDSWRDFARDNGEAEGSQKAFGENLGKRGFARDRVNSLGRIYRGLDVRKHHVA